MKPEFKIIINCAQIEASNLQRQQVKNLIDGPVDWELLINASVSHGVLPLVLRSLEAFCPEKIPTHAQNRMRRTSLKNSIFNLHVTGKLLDTLKCLNSHGIPTMTFKGPILSLIAYGDLSLRQFSDIDILVPANNLKDSISVLTKSMSYRQSRDWRFISQTVESIYSNTQHEYDLQNDGVFLDLHRSLLPEYFLRSNLTYSDLQSESRTVEFSGGQVTTLGVEDTLLYLCIHASKECWRSLKWICDINEYINIHHNLNWQRLIEKANRLNALRMLTIGCLLVKNLFDNALVHNYFSEIPKDVSSLQMVDRLTRQLFLSEKQITHRFSFSRLALHIQMMETLSDKFNTLQYILYPVRNRLDLVFPTVKA